MFQLLQVIPVFPPYERGSDAVADDLREKQLFIRHLLWKIGKTGSQSVNLAWRPAEEDVFAAGKLPADQTETAAQITFQIFGITEDGQLSGIINRPMKHFSFTENRAVYVSLSASCEERLRQGWESAPGSTSPQNLGTGMLERIDRCFLIRPFFSFHGQRADRHTLSALCAPDRIDPGIMKTFLIGFHVYSRDRTNRCAGAAAAAVCLIFEQAYHSSVPVPAGSGVTAAHLFLLRGQFTIMTEYTMHNITNSKIAHKSGRCTRAPEVMTGECHG